MSAPADQVQLDNHMHSMVRVLDVQGPRGQVDPTWPISNLPTCTLIGPSPETAAFLIRPFTWNDRSYLVVTDIGGTVQLWDLTDLRLHPAPYILDPITTPSADYAHFMLQEWQAPPSVTDNIPNSIFGLAVDLADTTGDPAPDEVDVYIAVARVGVEVLQFDPNAHLLVHKDHIETPSGSAGLDLRVAVPGGPATDLLVAERNCGIRVFDRHP